MNSLPQGGAREGKMDVSIIKRIAARHPFPWRIVPNFFNHNFSAIVDRTGTPVIAEVSSDKEISEFVLNTLNDFGDLND